MQKFLEMFMRQRAESLNIVCDVHKQGMELGVTGLPDVPFQWRQKRKRWRKENG